MAERLPSMHRVPSFIPVLQRGRIADQLPEDPLGLVGSLGVCGHECVGGCGSPVATTRSGLFSKGLWPVSLPGEKKRTG